jgi:hemerythrin
MNRRNKKLVVIALIATLSLAAVAILWQGGLASPGLWLVLAALGLVPLLLRRETCKDFVAWREDFGVGFALIDRDHQKLLSLINNVLASQRCETGNVLERQALDELLDYTEYHFRHEEELMTRYAYRDYEAHKAQHDYMRGQVKLHLERYRMQGREALPQLANHLKVWLLQHIAVTDRKLAPFLASQHTGEASDERAG